jgi:hypothetical protein
LLWVNPRFHKAQLHETLFELVDAVHLMGTHPGALCGRDIDRGVVEERDPMRGHTQLLHDVIEDLGLRFEQSQLVREVAPHVMRLEGLPVERSVQGVRVAEASDSEIPRKPTEEPGGSGIEPAKPAHELAKELVGPKAEWPLGEEAIGELVRCDAATLEETDRFRADPTPTDHSPVHLRKQTAQLLEPREIDQDPAEVEEQDVKRPFSDHRSPPNQAQVCRGLSRRSP